jgi:hypothetical protein
MLMSCTSWELLWIGGYVICLSTGGFRPIFPFMEPHLTVAEGTASPSVDSPIDRRAIKQRPANYYSRLTSKPQRPAVSQRSALGKRLRDLADGFAERLGGWPVLSVGAAAAVRRAAELVALSEQTRRDALCNGGVDPDRLLRLDGAAARAVRALGLKIEPVPPKTTRGLQRARERWAADEKAKSATVKETNPNGRRAED